MNGTYEPRIFDVATIDQAKRIILTDEGSTVRLRLRHRPPRHGCCILGIDISAGTRALALAFGYVASDRFFACAPAMRDVLCARGFAADAAISIWVLQHCEPLAEDIAPIGRAPPAGRAALGRQQPRAGAADDPAPGARFEVAAAPGG